MTDDRPACGFLSKAHQIRACATALLAALIVTGSPGTAGGASGGASTGPARAGKRKQQHRPAQPSNPFAGRGMWIWVLSRSDGGDLYKIVARAHRNGIDTVMIKSSDGTSAWPQFNPQVVSALHASGLRVCAWQYVYGDQPSIEAQLGAAAVHDGADCLLIDAESEYEGKYVQAQTYTARLRELIGSSFPVALAGFPYIDYHPAFPYSVFLGPGGAQYDVPQMYWVDIGTSVDGVYAHTYIYNRLYRRQIDPLGQIYEDPPPGQIVRFRELSRLFGAPGLSWWDWQEASGRGWRAISTPAPSLGGSAGDAVATIRRGWNGDLVVWAQEHLVTAGYSIPVDGAFGARTLSAVESFQVAHGLAVDGVIGVDTWQALLRYQPARVKWTRTGATVASAAGASVRSVPVSASLHATAEEIPNGIGAGWPKR